MWPQLDQIPERVINQAAKIRLAVFDVDGVFTDGRLWFTDDAREFKSFHVQDGMGIKLLAGAGIRCAIITARFSPVVTRRANELGIELVYQDQDDKLACFQRMLAALKLTPEQASYTGDDLPDLPVLKRAGLAVGVANAHPFLRPHCHYLTHAVGGAGAVREVADLLLFAQGRLADIGKRFGHG
jgi:3-deoxy-D-manno-octulosonate 8-phosphate phosphatase (KDO 8-P phosphatase)